MSYPRHMRATMLLNLALLELVYGFEMEALLIRLDLENQLGGHRNLEMGESTEIAFL
jgi:hypothetical protein